MATYAIGDVQGCYAALERLLLKIRFDPRRDRLWFVGDLVNRGPDSLAVLRFVRGLGAAAVTVLGNHDLYLLALSEGLVPRRGDDTLQDVLKAPDRWELVDWLRRRPLLHIEPGFVLVHAGLLPDWTVDEAAGLAAEAEALLRSDDYPGLLRTLFEPEAVPRRWHPELDGARRVALAVAAFTRLRTCRADGSMDEGYTGPLATLPPGLSPWFGMPGRRSQEATIVCGHWAALGLHIRPNLLAIDGGCVWGGRLIAVRLDDRQPFEVSCGG